MFPEKHAVLIVGDPTAGMFEFCCYLGSTYLKNGERVLFVETNTTPTQVRRQFEQFGVDPIDFEAAGSFVIIDCYTSEQARTLDAMSLRVSDINSLGEIAEKVNEGINKVGGYPVRVLFDSLTALYTHHDAKAVGLLFKTLASLVKRNGAITFVLHRGLLTEEQIAPIESIVDSILEMKVDVDFRRYVRIKYLRGVKVSPRWVPFDFEIEEEEGAAASLAWRRE
ncbi:MAG: RAD55 family ATPase [Thermoplasmata archaeon]